MTTIEGRWELSDPTECAAEYPSELEFVADVYAVPQDPDRPAGPLGGGDYLIVDERTIELMAPNDAMHRYSYRLATGELILEDPAGCTVRYVRA